MIAANEARLMTRAAEYFKVKTQMGNQAHAGEPIRRAVELIRAGIIGPVREVHAWTNRPIWPQGAKAIQDRKDMMSQPKPKDLDWDLWLGPAKLRDYNACYMPFKWRGWWIARSRRRSNRNGRATRSQVDVVRRHPRGASECAL